MEALICGEPRGAQMVGAKSAAFALTWLMPMLTDYGIYPPRPLDVALPLAQVGDETDFEVSGLKFRALFVPGHSFDLTVYMVELGGQRLAFTGDLGFENQDILHRCWGDADKARAVRASDPRQTARVASGRRLHRPWCATQRDGIYRDAGSANRRIT